MRIVGYLVAVLLGLAAGAVGVVVAWQGEGDGSIAMGGAAVAVGCLLIGGAFFTWLHEPQVAREKARRLKAESIGAEERSSAENTTQSETTGPTVRIRASRPMEIASRFKLYLPRIVLAAAVYCSVFSLPVFYFVKDRVEPQRAWPIALTISGVVVGMLGFLFARHVCVQLSRSIFALNDNSLRVKGLRGSKSVEVAFDFSEIHRVVFGQPLNGAEKLLDSLHKIGVRRASQKATKDLRAGRLAIFDRDNRGTVFHFVNKAFTERDLSKCFETLAAKGVRIDLA